MVTLLSQTAEWEECESDLDEDDIFDLEGTEGEGTGDHEDKVTWTGALLKTSFGGFLHGLTGTKVRAQSDSKMSWSLGTNEGLQLKALVALMCCKSFAIEAPIFSVGDMKKILRSRRSSFRVRKYC